MANRWGERLIESRRSRENPFDRVISRIDEGIARRIKERQEENKEIRTLRDLFKTMREETSQQKELIQERGKEERKTKREFPPKLGRTEAIEEGIRGAQRGEVDWKGLKRQYPLAADKISQAELQATPVEKSPEFGEGRGLRALFSPHRAKLTPKTQRMIDQIESQADLNEFLDRVDKEIKSGNWTENDKNTVLEYFGLR